MCVSSVLLLLHHSHCKEQPGADARAQLGVTSVQSEERVHNLWVKNRKVQQADEAKVAAERRLFQQRHISGGRFATEKELFLQHPSPKYGVSFSIVRPKPPPQKKITKPTFEQTNTRTKTTPATMF